jgi:hypothetical protein
MGMAMAKGWRWGGDGDGEGMAMAKGWRWGGDGDGEEMAMARREVAVRADKR